MASSAENTLEQTPLLYFELFCLTYSKDNLAFCTRAPLDSNLPPPAKLSVAQKGPAHCLRLHKRDSVWDSSSLADDSFKPYSVGKEHKQICPNIYWIHAPKAIMTANSSQGKAGLEVNLHSRPLLLGLGGSSKPRPHQSQRNKHQHISINNTQAMQGKFLGYNPPAPCPDLHHGTL